MDQDETIQPNYLEIGSEPATSNEGFDPEATPEANSPTTPPTPVTNNPNIVQLGEDGVLTFGNLRSPNFSTGNSGWRITSNGDVEFGSGYFRGDITGATGTFTGNISGGSIDIGGSDATSFHVDTSGNMWLGASAFNIATNPFAVSSAGVLRATSGTIGGFTMSSTELYGGIIKTGATVGVGSNGVIMDTSGLRMYDSVLGLVVNLPSNGDAPTFSSGVISSTTYEINTNAVMRTSSTVGDGSANSDGILINDTGFYACETNQTLANANVRILADGSGFFSGTFEIGGATKTIDAVADLQTALDDIATAGGGTVYLKSGTYTLTADISIPGGVTLQGVSRDGVIIDCDGTYAVKIVGTNVYSTGTVTINNGDTTVVGSGTTWTAGMVGRYVLLDGLWYEITARTDNTHITITTYQGVNLAGSAYVLADVVFDAKLNDVTITGATGSGFVVQYAQEPIAENVVIYGCGTGIEMDYVTYPKIVVSSNENGVNLNMNFVEGFYVDYSDLSYSTSGNGVTMTNTRNSTFFNSSVNDNTGDGINCTTCSKITFISFDISGNGGQGVEMVSACDDNQFTDGTFDGNTSDGIKFTATSDRNTLVAVSITNNGGYGINIAASTCDNNQIIAPAFDSNSSGNINDSGTGTFISPQEFSSDVQTFTSGTSDWVKPNFGSQVLVQMWGGGGGGGAQGGGGAGGGGGGGYQEKIFLIGDLSDPVSVTVGAGGAGGTSSTAGGNSTFGAYLIAYGGSYSRNSFGGGGGGGLQGAGTASASANGGVGGFLYSASGGGAAGTSGAAGGNSTEGGGGGGFTGTTPTSGGESIYGGGGGGGGDSNSSNTATGGKSYYGGGGGGGAAASGTSTGGTSKFGGAGGAGGASGGTNGTVPGGGGGGTDSGTAGNGAAGKVIVTTF